jgi:hypothetical protein
MKNSKKNNSIEAKIITSKPLPLALFNQHCNTATLQHCNTATLQHCNTATF